MTNIKRGKANSYANKRLGKTDYGCGGFNGMPYVSYTNISDDRWALIDWSDDGKKEKDAEDKS